MDDYFKHLTESLDTEYFPDYEPLPESNEFWVNIITTDNFFFGTETISNTLKDFFRSIDLSQSQVFEIDSIGCLAECC